MTIALQTYPSGRVAAFADWPNRTICGGPYPTEAVARVALDAILATVEAPYEAPERKGGAARHNGA